MTPNLGFMVGQHLMSMIVIIKRLVDSMLGKKAEPHDLYNQI